MILCFVGISVYDRLNHNLAKFWAKAEFGHITNANKMKCLKLQKPFKEELYDNMYLSIQLRVQKPNRRPDLIVPNMISHECS